MRRYKCMYLRVCKCVYAVCKQRWLNEDTTCRYALRDRE